jgi:hypothetical protein
MHNARIRVLRALTKPSVKLDDPHIIQAVSECVRTIASHGELSEANALMNKFSTFDPPKLQLCFLAGLEESKNISWDAISMVEKLDPLASEEISESLIRIYSVHGWHPDKFSAREELIQFGSSRADLFIPLIGCLRKIKSQKKFTWNLYKSYCVSHPTDPPILTEYIATMCGINGWFQRVPLVLSRLGPNASSPLAAKFLIKAYCHHPLGEEMNNEVEKLVRLVGDMSSPQSELIPALIDFYSLNGQFRAAVDLLESADETNMSMYRPLFKRTNHAKLFFLVLNVARHRLGETVLRDSRVAEKCLDFALSSPATLVTVLEWFHVEKVPVSVVNRSRIRAEATKPRIKELLEMIEKNSI